jgi:acetyl esterase/lipase
MKHMRWILFWAAIGLWAQQPGDEVHKNLVYGRAGERDLLLDLYLPPAADRPAPLVVWVHGGAWQSGSKENTPARWLVQHGYAVASVSYRLSGVAKFPAQIDDCQAAVRWLRANASKYGFRPDRFAAWGSSAGGHLVSLLGVMPGDAQVQAVIDFYGPTDLLQMSKFPSTMDHDSPESPESRLIGGPIQQNKEKAEKANPIRYVSKTSSPFLIVHGDKDPLVPINQSELLLAALQKAGVEAKYHVIAGGGHGGPGFQAEEVRTMILEFLKRNLKGK